MKILLHSHTFHPAVGGVETISATLAEQLCNLGHQVVVVTETPGDSTRPFCFEVVRRPSIRERWKLARSVDIIHSNGASLGMVPYAAMSGVPFAWTHNGYQVTCVDGLGWNEDGPTPMEPMASFRHHLKRLGLARGLVQGIKLGARRLVAKHFAYNIAATKWVASRQCLPNQQVSYTPYPLDRFAQGAVKIEQKYDFVFVGRMVNEKGVETLIRAMAVLQGGRELSGASLALVGDGPLRPQLEDLAASLGLKSAVHFLGLLQGEDLIRAICSAPIGVVPSVYEEPMGGVALELLASGRCVIVSERGGMAECVGDAGLCFKNGEPSDLADKMWLLATDGTLRNHLLERAKSQMLLFHETELAKRYVSIYQDIAKVRKHLT